MVFSFTRAQNGDLERALERARRLLTSHGTTTTRGGGDGGGATYSVPLSARRGMIEETERGTAEFQVVSRAPMRVVALGRSGVGKSHVLNRLLRELASRDAPPPSAAVETDSPFGDSAFRDGDAVFDAARADRAYDKIPAYVVSSPPPPWMMLRPP